MMASTAALTLSTLASGQLQCAQTKYSTSRASGRTWRKPYPRHRSPAPIQAADGSAQARVGELREREKEYKMQLDELKRLATEAHEQHCRSAHEAASASGRLDASADGSEGASVAALRSRIEAAVEAIQAGLVERDTEVRLLLLAALSGEHILYIGPPGTAKSELGRRLCRLCSDGATYFERLLTRFSVPEELFGPLSMRALEEDKYIRQTQGYLPEATVAFVDEIFKANSAILNTLLTILNERLFDNGATRVHVPLLCLVGASNELPESEELDALYDRFLLRRQVSQVSPAGLLEMLGNTSSTDAGARAARALRSPGDSTDEALGPLLSRGDFVGTRARALAAVEVPPSVLHLISDLRSYLQDKCEPPVYVSDRRLVKAVALMQVAAYTNGRSRLSEYDCLLLQHILWQRPEEADRIYTWLLNALSNWETNSAQFKEIQKSLFSRTCRALGDEDKLKELEPEVAALRAALVDRLTGVYTNMSDNFGAVSSNLWLGKEESAVVQTDMLPKLEKAREEVEKLLFEAVTLEEALLRRCDPVVLAEVLPNAWSDFVRNAPREEVKPLGTRPLANASFASGSTRAFWWQTPGSQLNPGANNPPGP